MEINLSTLIMAGIVGGISGAIINLFTSPVVIIIQRYFPRFLDRIEKKKKDEEEK